MNEIPIQVLIETVEIYCTSFGNEQTVRMFAAVEVLIVFFVLNIFPMQEESTQVSKNRTESE